MPTDRQIIAFVDTAENFHPWECDGQGRCRHCDRKKDDTHDPDTCAFCMDDAGLLEGDPMTDELGGGAPTREDGEPVATSAALPPPAQPPSPEPCGTCKGTGVQFTAAQVRHVGRQYPCPTHSTASVPHGTLRVPQVWGDCKRRQCRRCQDYRAGHRGIRQEP